MCSCGLSFPFIYVWYRCDDGTSMSLKSLMCAYASVFVDASAVDPFDCVRTHTHRCMYNEHSSKGKWDKCAVAFNGTVSDIREKKGVCECKQIAPAPTQMRKTNSLLKKDAKKQLPNYRIFSHTNKVKQYIYYIYFIEESNF